MTENMSDNSPTKKRKANDGRATTTVSHGGGGGLFSSWLGYFTGRPDGTTPTAQSTTCGGGENLTQKMDAMMQMMSRMEDKCSRLEAECSSLKNELNGVKKTQLQQFEYNTMLLKNQSWNYSASLNSAAYWRDAGHNQDVAAYLSDYSEYLRELTKKLRRGEFPDNYDKKGIDLVWDVGDPILDDDAGDDMQPHWIEFAMALKQFAPTFGVLPDSCETYFTLENVQLPRYLPGLLKNALMNKPFQTLSFVNKTEVGDDEGMKLEDIMDIMESNKHLQKLTIGNNRIQLGHMEKICSAVRYGSIVKLDLRDCFENGLGEEMMTSLLTNVGSKLQRLGLDSNDIASSSSEIALLADFLATNPPLKELDLEDNLLLHNDAEVLANALRSNTSLRKLDLSYNAISHVGNEAFRLVLHNDSSLNSVADSNHSCTVEGAGSDCWTANRFWEDGAWREKPESFNRAQKIYKLLSERNKSTSTSNVQHFDDIDVKILPDMLKSVQTYASMVHSDDRYAPDYCRAKALSIVYEVMRKWDKAFPLYTDRGNSDSI